MIYNNTTADMILGCLFNDTTLCIDGKYTLNKDEFKRNYFHYVIYVTLLNLSKKGIKKATVLDVVEFLKNYESEYNIFMDNQGEQYLLTVADIANVDNYEYYYKKFRKFSLLHECNENGIDIKDIYDPTTDTTTQEAKLEDMDIDDLVGRIEGKLLRITKEYQLNGVHEEYVAGTDFLESMEMFKEAPLLGYSFQSPLLNEILRGMFGFLIRAGASGSGKSIMSIADLLACTCTEYYDYDTERYVKNASRVGSGLFINTELELREELDPIMIAYISGVSRSHIIDGKYEDGEEERVVYASKVLSDSEIHIVDHPEFDIKSLKDIIKHYVYNKGVKVTCFDYIANNGIVAKKLASESKIPQREDMVLLALTDALKQVQRETKTNLISAVQTNGQEDNMEFATEGCFAGGRSQVRKTNGAYAMLNPKEKELSLTKELCDKWNNNHKKQRFGGEYIKPNKVIHMIKGRGSAYPKYMKVFQYIDLGTGRSTDMYCTDKYCHPLNVVGRKIEYVD